MFLVFLFAFIGLIAGGFGGLLIGGALGYAATEAFRRFVVQNLEVAQSQLIESTFAIMGAVCKADSVVSRDEIRVVEQIFTMLRLNDAMRTEAKAAFSRGKAKDFDLDAETDRFARIARGRAPLLQLFLQLQVMAVAADGRVHPAEHAMLVRIARRLGLNENDVAQLEALLRAGEPTGPGAPPSKSRLDDAYQALGISPDATAAEIKRAYRKLMSQNHPDKLASRGLPESMRAVAEERSREINSAYDLIKADRKFV
jgi:DnaJ like chaperone protein